MYRSKGSKRAVIQPCDNCSRDFTPRPKPDGSHDWRCCWCGFDNKCGLTFAKNGYEKASKKDR